MPIYEYECQACGHRLEALQMLSEDPLRDCPECGRPELRRLISAAGFRLKGSGWYETDFKKDGKRNIARSDSAEGKSSSGGAKKESNGGSGKAAASSSE
ncbi:MAG TPA: zinc ribbon domain-containing protein [Gammaproteobacteria bacterium]|nr:zinc ribbon domain-containing protein [Gammaproteobacteria bacterium]